VDAIYIPHLLKIPSKCRELQIDAPIAGLDTLTVPRGWLQVVHRHTFLDVSARAEAIVTLTCDRTLKQYNHKLVVDTSELIVLAATELDADERALPGEELAESLPPDGYFDPETWLYEQFCLAMPLRQLSDDASPPGTYDYRDAPQLDSRFAELSALRDHFASN